MSGDHKSHCHRKDTRLGANCPCQKYSRCPQVKIHDRHTKSYLTPDSTEDCAVFEYDKDNHKWKASNYSPSQTKDRASVNEIEEFLNEINEPLEAWYQKYGKLVSDEGVYNCIGCLLLLLFPLFLIYVWWFNENEVQTPPSGIFLGYQGVKKANAKLEEVKDEVCAIVRKRGPYFSAKSLAWNIPEQFPQWIELWLEEEDNHLLGKDGEKSAMVAYEESGYPKTPQYGNKVVPIEGQQQFVYHSNMFEQAHENFSS